MHPRRRRMGHRTGRAFRTRGCLRHAGPLRRHPPRLPRRLVGFSTWCQALGRKPLAADADTIAMYVVHRADDGSPSAARACTSPPSGPRTCSPAPARPEPPAARRGTRRPSSAPKGTRPRRRAAPALPDILRKMLAARQGADTAFSARDWGMLLLGFGAALCRRRTSPTAE